MSRQQIFIVSAVMAGSCVLLLLCGLVVVNLLRTPMKDVVVAESTSADGAFNARVINRVAQSNVPDSTRVVVTDQRGSGMRQSSDEKIIEFKRPVVYGVIWLDDNTLVIEYDDYYEWSVLFDYYSLYAKESSRWHGVTILLRGGRPPQN